MSLFLIDETQEYTNNFYVFEFTKIALFEAGYVALSIDEIVEKIEELAGLKYTEQEVLSAIEQWNSGCIERKSKKYSLTTLGLELMSNRAQAINIKQYTDLFIKEQSSDCQISADQLKDLVEKFIFLRFNENLKQICDIFNQSLAIEEIEEDFDDNYEEELKTELKKSTLKTAVKNIIEKYNLKEYPNLISIPIETTEDMYNALEKESNNKYDLICI